MSNDVTTSDGGSPMTPPTSRRRALWVATGVAGLTGVVGLAALGGLAARDNDKADDAKRVAENHAAAPQNVSDAGKADDKKDGDKGKGGDADAQNAADGSGRDGKDRDNDWDGKDRDSDEHGHVREVPCDEEKLIEAVDLANRDHGGTLKLAPHCTYELSFADKKSGTGLPTIKQEITIKGNDATIRRDSEDAFRIFRVTDGGNLTLKDLTVSDGNAAEFKYSGPPVPMAAAPQNGTDAQATPPPPPPTKDGEGDGGALLVEHGGSAHLKKVELTRNNAENNGGAIANFGRVDLDNSNVENNHARNNGGGIFTVGVLRITESHITRNTAGDNGGGIANGNGGRKAPAVLVDGRDKAGTVEIFKTTIEDNQAGENGGGVFSSGGFVKIAMSAIKGNTACHNGGGIYARHTDLDLDKVAVVKNHADNDGGGIDTTGGEKRNDLLPPNGHKQEATATIANSTIADNTAGHFGGGIFNGEEGLNKVEEGYQEWIEGNGDNARLTLRDTDIKANTAENGGGIFNNEGTVTLTKTHVTKNTATDSSKGHRVAGGILNHKGKVHLDDESTVTNNDPTNCASTVKNCFN